MWNLIINHFSYFMGAYKCIMLHIFSYTYLNVAPGTFSNQNNGITLDTFLYVNVNVKRTSNHFKCNDCKIYFIKEKYLEQHISELHEIGKTSKWAKSSSKEPLVHLKNLGPIENWILFSFCFYVKLPSWNKSSIKKALMCRIRTFRKLEN